jgi:recombination protein RecR
MIAKYSPPVSAGGLKQYVVHAGMLIGVQEFSAVIRTFAQMNSFPSRIFEQAVNEFATLPGIGRRSAVRMVLHMLRQNPTDARRFGETMIRLTQEIRFCKNCNNISDSDLCSICADPRRDMGMVCVVEDVRDLLAVENTSQYRGLYHVLGGIISPMDGIGPANLAIDSLLEKLKPEAVNEVIMALSATMEGDTTVFYLYKKITQLDRTTLKLSSIARGVSIGDDLEYADEVTLGRSILNRTPYESTLAR